MNDLITHKTYNITLDSVVADTAEITLDSVVADTAEITLDSVVADTAENRIEKKFNKVNMIYNYTINCDNFKTVFYNYILDLKLKTIFNKGIESLSKKNQEKIIDFNEIILLDLTKKKLIIKNNKRSFRVYRAYRAK